MSRLTIHVTGLFLLLLTACTMSKQERGEQLYQTNCASCHIAPSPQDLPKHLWKESVLPEMAARMGIKDSTYNPYAKNTFPEQEAMMKTGIYSVRPAMTMEDWKLLKAYVIESAPEKLEILPSRLLNAPLAQFAANPINLDSISGSSITFLDVNSEKGIIVSADLRGSVLAYDYRTKERVRQDNFQTSITSYTAKDSFDFVTMVGYLNPSEIARGKIYKVKNKRVEEVATNLHRPVHTSVYDFDKNGVDELIVSEFGHLTGALSLWSADEADSYKKKVLLGQPGIVRSIIKDMNNDGEADIVVLSSQGNEGVTILYHTGDLNFRSEQVIRFNPVYGSSWFDLVDYNNDGYDDIITVNGDNADNTYVNKPYHGMRIHINNGQNQFEEKYFYPLYGATRFVANDFDKDGDIDLGIVASFPDYEESPEFSFVYLENIDAENFNFKAYGLEEPSLGRWLLIDSGDVDNDGDLDIVLSSFTYYFTPVPEDLFKKWSASNIDVMVLENKLQ